MQKFLTAGGSRKVSMLKNVNTNCVLSYLHIVMQHSLADFDIKGFPL